MRDLEWMGEVGEMEREGIGWVENVGQTKGGEARSGARNR